MTHLSLLCSREDQVPHHDGRQQGLDAGHFLPEREDRAVSHHSDAQPLR